MERFQARIEGGWRHSQDLTRRLVINVDDPGNGTHIFEVDIPADVVLNLLSNSHTSDAPLADVKFWGTEYIGKEHQMLALSVPIGGWGEDHLAKAIDEINATYGPLGFLPIRDRSWNSHRVSGTSGAWRYDVAIHRYVEPGTPKIPAAPEHAIPAPKAAKPPRKKARS